MLIKKKFQRKGMKKLKIPQKPNKKNLLQNLKKNKRKRKSQSKKNLHKKLLQSMEMNLTTLETNSKTSKLMNWKNKNQNQSKKMNKNPQHLKKRKIPSIFPLTSLMPNSNRTKNQQFTPKRNPKTLQSCSFKMMVKKNKILLLSWALSLRKVSHSLSSDSRLHQRKVQMKNLKPLFCHLFQNKRKKNNLGRLVMNL